MVCNNYYGDYDDYCLDDYLVDYDADDDSEVDDND